MKNFWPLWIGVLLMATLLLTVDAKQTHSPRRDLLWQIYKQKTAHICVYITDTIAVDIPETGYHGLGGTWAISCSQPASWIMNGDTLISLSADSMVVLITSNVAVESSGRRSRLFYGVEKNGALISGATMMASIERRNVITPIGLHAVTTIGTNDTINLVVGCDRAGVTITHNRAMLTLVSLQRWNLDIEE